MGRALIGLIPILALVFFFGLSLGRAQKKKAIAKATENVRTIVTTARQLVALDPIADPADYQLGVSMMKFDLDKYDENNRQALM